MVAIVGEADVAEVQKGREKSPEPFLLVVGYAEGGERGGEAVKLLSVVDLLFWLVLVRFGLGWIGVFCLVSKAGATPGTKGMRESQGVEAQSVAGKEQYFNHSAYKQAPCPGMKQPARTVQHHAEQFPPHRSA